MGECIGGCGTQVLDPEAGPSHNVKQAKLSEREEDRSPCNPPCCSNTNTLYTTQAGTEGRSTIYIKALINHHI